MGWYRCYIAKKKCRTGFLVVKFATEYDSGLCSTQKSVAHDVLAIYQRGLRGFLKVFQQNFSFWQFQTLKTQIKFTTPIEKVGSYQNTSPRPMQKNYKISEPPENGHRKKVNFFRLTESYRKIMHCRLKRLTTFHSTENLQSIMSP